MFYRYCTYNKYRKATELNMYRKDGKKQIVWLISLVSVIEYIHIVHGIDKLGRYIIHKYIHVCDIHKYDEYVLRASNGNCKKRE